jgi:hypothetical protein
MGDISPPEKLLDNFPPLSYYIFAIRHVFVLCRRWNANGAVMNKKVAPPTPIGGENHGRFFAFVFDSGRWVIRLRLPGAKFVESLAQRAHSLQ